MKSFFNQVDIVKPQIARAVQEGENKTENDDDDEIVLRARNLYFLTISHNDRNTWERDWRKEEDEEKQALSTLRR